MAQSRVYTNKDIEKYVVKDEPPPDILDELNELDEPPPDILDETPVSNTISKLPDNAPDTWMEGFKQSVLGGEASNVGMQGAKGWLKGAILDIPESIKTIPGMAKSAFELINPTQWYDHPPQEKIKSGIEMVKGMANLTSQAGNQPEEFGRMMGQLTGQPIVTEGIVRGMPPAIRGTGVVAENAGRIMNKYTPISTATGAAVGASYGGFPGAVLGTMRPSTAFLRAIERPIGRGIESVGKKMRQFGKGRVKVVDGQIVESPDGSPFKEGEFIQVFPKELPPSKTSFYGPEKNPDPKRPILALPPSSLVEGTELTKSVKPRVRLNKDGTYINLDTGELVDSQGNPVPLPPPPPGMVRPSGSIDVKPGDSVQVRTPSVATSKPKLVNNNEPLQEGAVRIQNLGSNTTPFKAKNSKLEEEYYNNEIMTKGQKESVEMMPGIEESIRRERALDLQEGQSLATSQPKGIAPDQRAKIMRGMNDPVDVLFPDTISREVFGAGSIAAAGRNVRVRKQLMQRYTDASKRVAEQYGLSEQASRSMVSQYNQYIRQLSTGQPKYGEGLSVKAPSFQEFIESKISNEPLQARSEQGGIKIGSNTKRAVGELTTGYSGQLEGIMIREAMQNALDAIRSKGNTGNIDLNLTNTGFTMTDNGNGMTLKQLETVFSDLYSSGKVAEEGATGGKGIGKSTYMMGGERFEVSTVAIDNGKRYRITLSGTPDEFSENVMPVIEEVPDTVPLGTSIRTDFLPEKYGSSSSAIMFDKIIRNSRELTGTVTFERNYAGKNTKLFKDWSNDKVIAEKQIEGHDVKIAIPDDAFFSERGGLDVQVLNNGMYQYEKFLYFAGKDVPNMPNKVIANIKPNAAEGTVEYPFPTQRESLKNSFDTKLDQLINTILVEPAIIGHKTKLVELYASMDELRPPNVREMVINDPGARLWPNELMSLKNNPSIYEFSGVIEEFLDNILDSIGDSVLSDRLERTGITLDPNSHGMHIPNPDTGKSAILINPFINIGRLEPAQAALEAVVTILHEVAHIGKDSPYFESFSPGELNDPRIGRYLESYMKEVMDHGGLDAGHGVSFIKRLAQVYGKTPVRLSFKTADKIQSIYDPSNTGGYSGNIKEALQIYIESRRREATTEDFLSRTGVKQKSKGSGKGNVFSNTKRPSNSPFRKNYNPTGLKEFPDLIDGQSLGKFKK